MIIFDSQLGFMLERLGVKLFTYEGDWLKDSESEKEIYVQMNETYDGI